MAVNSSRSRPSSWCMTFALADITPAENIEFLFHSGPPLHHHMAAVTTPDAGTHVTKRPGRNRPAVFLAAVSKCLRTRRHPPDHQSQGEKAILSPTAKSSDFGDPINVTVAQLMGPRKYVSLGGQYDPLRTVPECNEAGFRVIAVQSGSPGTLWTVLSLPQKVYVQIHLQVPLNCCYLPS